MKYVVTHRGRAHRDEFLAVGLLCCILGHDVTVYRRNPTEDELDDPEVYVLDVGNRHEPDLNNFDHHQMPHGTRDCALSLLAKAREHSEGETYHALFGDAPWYKAVILQDTMGRSAVTAEMGIAQAEMDAGSVIESHVLALFAKNHGKEMALPQSVLFAKEIMSGRITASLKIRDRVEEIERKSAVLFARIGENDWPVLYAPGIEAFGVSSWAQHKGIPLIASVTRDARSGGAVIYRQGYGDGMLDFRLVSNSPLAVFTHASGFMMSVSKGADAGDILGLIEAAAWPEYHRQQAQGGIPLSPAWISRQKSKPVSSVIQVQQDIPFGF